MTTDAAPRTRPVLVTVVLVFVYLSGLANTGLGLLVLLSRYQVDADAVLGVSLLGSGIILFGLLTLAVASAVGRGSRLARVAVTVYIVAQFALQFATIATTDWDAATIVPLAVGAFIVIAMWVPPGRRWFRR
jgi:holin-like protein